MFTALINLVVDFLFVDILFAPTMNSTKRETKLSPKLNQKVSVSKESSVAVEKANEQVQQSTSPPAPNSNSTPLTPVMKDSSSQFKRVTRHTLTKIQSGNLDLETTRVLPSSTLEAHELAKLSVNDIIDDRVSAIRQTLVRQETQRRASSRRSVSFMKNIPLNEMSVDDQFVDLSVDIAEQRKELKRNQQDKFDEMWG
jgi:hypothetical protein